MGDGVWYLEHKECFTTPSTLVPGCQKNEYTFVRESREENSLSPDSITLTMGSRFQKLYWLDLEMPYEQELRYKLTLGRDYGPGVVRLGSTRHQSTGIPYCVGGWYTLTDPHSAAYWDDILGEVITVDFLVRVLCAASPGSEL